MTPVVIGSYMGAGSSAFTDCLLDHENVSCPNGSFEYVFLYMPDGLFDLEDKLLLANNASRSDEAIRSFRKAMLDVYNNPTWGMGGYKKKVSPLFMDRVDQFIDEIALCSFEGYWYDHELVSAASKFVGRVIRKLKINDGRRFLRTYNDRMTVAFPSPEQFYTAARSFVADVLAMPDENADIAVFDQLMQPHNANRFGRYMPDGARMIVSQRDPRDVFLLNKYYWRRQNEQIPFPFDAEVFCVYYRALRESVPPLDPRKVQTYFFEDLVFDFDATMAQIRTFLGLDLGSKRIGGARFEPERSMRNVGIYLENEQYAEEAAIIEQRLPEYLYPGDISRAVAVSQGDAF
ncbi:sulfotransferase [Adlercreutzia aquisgranensis]|uniref:sulfotransferase n=1 Tax=Adlercreutzia aquisgranensis TaxID=2941323 RepID=UPI00203A8BB6|nr:sulfotransferase [Adlercreutzia aquisgranensis]